MQLDQFAKYCWSHLPVTKKTIENYRGAFNRNIYPHFGDRDMATVSRNEFVNILAPLAPQNYFQTLMMLRVLYREALLRELVVESPVSSIRAPRIHVQPQKFLTWEEVRDTNFGKYDSQVKFLALHGLRWGEAVALKNSDISDDKVSINRSVHGATKTVAGVRQVPYFGYFKEFPRTRVPIAKALEPYGVTIHSLRKTYAYFLKSNNVHVTTAAKFMGHSNPLVTLKIYTLVRDDEINLVGDELRKVLTFSPDLARDTSDTLTQSHLATRSMAPIQES
jgi:integrase